MLLGDLRLLTPAKLAAAAKYYGLAQRGKKGIWSMRKSLLDPVTRQERPCKRSMETVDLRTAVGRAAQAWEEHVGAVQGHRLVTLAEPGRCASLERICEVYEQAATCDPATRTGNVHELKRLMAEMFPSVPWAALTADGLDGRAVRRWQLQRKGEAEKLLPDVPGCERAKRGANDLYRKARSVFSRRMLAAYEDEGLKLPATIRDFAQQVMLEAEPPPPSEQLPSDVEAKMWRLMPRLKQVRPAVWAAVLLMSRGGLRSAAVCHARWRWLQVLADGNYRLQLHAQDDFRPKAREKFVDLHASVIEALRTVRPMPTSDEDYLVPARVPREREDAVYRGANKFLRACGVSEIKGKIAYRLRGHAITLQILRHGIDAGQAFAGHTSQRTTAGYQGADVPYTPLELPAAASGVNVAAS